MEVVGQERIGKTISGTEFSVSVYRPTKKILPAERVSFTEEHAALLHEIMKGTEKWHPVWKKPRENHPDSSDPFEIFCINHNTWRPWGFPFLFVHLTRDEA